MPQTKFKKNEAVLVPAAQMPNANSLPWALVPKTVLAQSQRSLTVDDGQGGTVEVASRLVHPATMGFLVLRIGDLDTETSLLDPLAKSVLQFLRLLVPDSDLRYVPLRTAQELDVHWAKNHGATSHVVVIAHGANGGLQFLDGAGTTHITGKALGARLGALTPKTKPKTFISLACGTGESAFAKGFSQTAVCRDLIGPKGSVHGAAASQFCQSLLSEHVLDGVEMNWAYNRAADNAVGGRKFRRWRDGKMYTAK